MQYSNLYILQTHLRPLESPVVDKQTKLPHLSFFQFRQIFMNTITITIIIIILGEKVWVKGRRQASGISWLVKTKIGTRPSGRICERQRFKWQFFLLLSSITIRDTVWRALSLTWWCTERHQVRSFKGTRLPGSTSKRRSEFESQHLLRLAKRARNSTSSLVNQISDWFGGLKHICLQFQKHFRFWIWEGGRELILCWKLLHLFISSCMFMICYCIFSHWDWNDCICVSGLIFWNYYYCHYHCYYYWDWNDCAGLIL